MKSNLNVLGKMSKESFKFLIKEIIKSIINEVHDLKDCSGRYGEDEVAVKAFGDDIEYVTQMVHDKGIIFKYIGSDKKGKYLWNQKDGGEWFAFNSKEQKWEPVYNGNGEEETGNPTEQSMSGAAGPVNGPMAFKKNSAMEELEEMTTTDGGTPGYNVPGWVAKNAGGSRRGIEGSKSLGYELTPIGKADMEKHGDKLI